MGGVPRGELGEQPAGDGHDPGPWAGDADDTEGPQVQGDRDALHLESALRGAVTDDADRGGQAAGPEPEHQAVLVVRTSLPQPGLEAVDDPEDGGEVRLAALAFASFRPDRPRERLVGRRERREVLRLDPAPPPGPAPPVPDPGREHEDWAHEPEEQHGG